MLVSGAARGGLMHMAFGPKPAEACYEGLMQLCVQTYIFVREPGSINPYVFGFSATCSVVGITVAVYHFVDNYEQIMKVLRPPASAIEDDYGPVKQGW